jgi:hypothetical protein
VILIDLNGDGELTDEFAAGVTSIHVSESSAIVPTPTTHYLDKENTAGPLILLELLPVKN